MIWIKQFRVRHCKSVGQNRFERNEWWARRQTFWDYSQHDRFCSSRSSSAVGTVTSTNLTPLFVCSSAKVCMISVELEQVDGLCDMFALLASTSGEANRKPSKRCWIRWWLDSSPQRFETSHTVNETDMAPRRVQSDWISLNKHCSPEQETIVNLLEFFCQFSCLFVFIWFVAPTRSGCLSCTTSR